MQNKPREISDDIRQYFILKREKKIDILKKCVKLLKDWGM